MTTTQRAQVASLRKEKNEVKYLKRVLMSQQLTEMP